MILVLGILKKIEVDLGHLILLLFHARVIRKTHHEWARILELLTVFADLRLFFVCVDRHCIRWSTRLSRHVLGQHILRGLSRISSRLDLSLQLRLKHISR